MKSAAGRTGRRLDGVDLLRGLAIFFVMMNHVHIRLRINKVPYGAGVPQALLDALVWNGQYGVQMFFAVSGFLIASMSLRRWGSPERVSLSSFYRMRFARIAPLLLALLAVLSGLHLAGFAPFTINPARTNLSRALVAALTFHVNWLEATKGYLPPSWDILWSLSVEEVFYLGFPIACVALRRGSLLAAVLLGFVVAGPFARAAAFNEVWKEYSYLGAMDAIALGCLTAMVCARVRVTPAMRRAAGWAGGILLALMLGASVSFRRLPVAKTEVDMSLVALGTCLVCVGSSAGARIGGPLRPLIWLGRRSYEVYLTHMFVVLALLNAFLAAGKPAGGVPLFFAGTAVLAGLLGEIVARVYSEPANRRLRGYGNVQEQALPAESCSG